MKQRFSSLDVKVIVAELNATLVSLRISNIYDLSSRIFLFKCAKPGAKQQLLVDSGFRAHLTSFTRTAASAPSQFVTRLRKYLKSRRITSVSQVGTDRVIEIVFSDGHYRLYLEFFAAGNIILTDADLTVLALLRQVSEGDEAVDVKLGSKYVLDAKQNYHGVPPVTTERIKETIEKQAATFRSAQQTGGKKAKRHKGGDDLRRALSVGFPEYPPHLLEHVFHKHALDPATKLEDSLQNKETLTRIEEAMNDAGDIFRSFDDKSEKQGYIIAKIRENKTPAVVEQASQQDVPEDNLLYDDFHPFLPAQFKDRPDTKVLVFDGFNKTVDEFYSSIESQKLSSKLTEREEAAKTKLDTAKNEHEKRLAGLQHVQELHIRKAQAVEANTHRVEEACAAVNGLVAQGMDWVDIGKLIENEQKRGNVVAQLIKLPLKLHENTVTLLLDEPGRADEESDDDADVTESEDESEDGNTKEAAPEKIEKRLAIDVDLALSGWSNARQYYDQKKTAAQKEVKTVAASEKALKSMEKKTQADLKKSLKQETQTLRATRKAFWFEKFLYFISSDGYLVIGGKDAQQNELIYRRYMKKGDIYVHADLHGASSVIIKNNPRTPDAPIPPSTLSQAGALSVCSSSAWDSKAVMAAWWVNADQVSKTAPTGEYLTTGGFMIRGQKNFLPPSQLLLGFACYFLISEGSRANHGKNRIHRADSMMTGEAEMLADDARGLDIEDDNDEVDHGEDAVPDVEDAADNAEDEIEEGNDAADDSDNESIVSEQDEDRKQRSNPLQLNGDSKHDDEPDEEIEIEQTDNEHNDNPAQAVDSKAHSATEDNDEDEEQERQQDQTDPSPSTPTTTTSDIESSSLRPLPSQSQSKPKQKQSQPKRGANTKAAKRRAAKYALQDAEDKALALSLLGSTKAEQRKAAEEEARASREEKLEKDRERRRAQHQKAADAEKAKQEKLAKQAEKNASGEAIDDDDEDGDEAGEDQAALDMQEHLNIDLLVPTPEPGDEIVAAIPVVAPWSALTRNKYKVKLQPGNVKKGKALKEIVGTWGGLAMRGAKVVDEKGVDKERVWPREIELIKAWRVEEIVGVVPVRGVRVVQGGGAGGASVWVKGKVGGGGGGGGGARGGKGSKKR